jgi:hypothetical protein
VRWLIQAPEMPTRINTSGPRQQADAKRAARPPARRALPPCSVAGLEVGVLGVVECAGMR